MAGWLPCLAGWLAGRAAGSERGSASGWAERSKWLLAGWLAGWLPGSQWLESLAGHSSQNPRQDATDSQQAIASLRPAC